MVEYHYDVNTEAFKRADNRGKSLYVNITEAQRIISLLNLGYSISDIEGKVSLSSPQGTITTVKSFIRNYKQGNINMPTDAPAPVKVFDSITDGSRIDLLEERVTKLEMIQKESVLDKVKSWIK